MSPPQWGPDVPTRPCPRSKSTVPITESMTMAAAKALGWSPSREVSRHSLPGRDKRLQQGHHKALGVGGERAHVFARRSEGRDRAAVDEVLRAGDGGSARRDEERHEVRDFRRPRGTPDGNAAERVHQALAGPLV